MIILTVQPSMNLQNCIDLLNSYGGGTLELNPTSTFYPGGDVILYSNITINGNGAEIDFEGGAYGFRIYGSDEYTTGTVSVNFNTTTVVGSGTTWTEDMVGQYILIGDYWYEIASVEDGTNLTLSWEYIGVDVTGATYVIATTKSNIIMNSLNIINSTDIPIDFKYTDSFKLDGILVMDSTYSVKGIDSANFAWIDSTNDTCDYGLILNNVPYCVLNNVSSANILVGDGFDLTNIPNSSLGIFSVQNIAGVGLRLNDCSNIGIINYSIIGCTSHGIELESGNDSLDFGSGYIRECGGDGIKFTATSDGIEVVTNNIQDCTGYSINIAASSCNENLICINRLVSGGSGTMNDSGTGTLIRSNVGISDN